MEKQKKIAVVNDFSGFGRCSLTVSVPIISAAAIQPCALPTAIFSNHTGYEEYFFDDYTHKMKSYYSKWEKLGLQFDGIYTGFLGSAEQTDIVVDFINNFSSNSPKIIVDPVMGDNGKTYATFTEKLCRHLTRLAKLADILTPNVTEACILADIPYQENMADTPKLLETAKRLQDKGSKNIVITGISSGNTISNFILKENGAYTLLSCPNIGCQRAGTGDVFSSIIAADAVNGCSLEESVQKASDFISEAIAISDCLNTPAQDGICFEPLLWKLSPYCPKERQS